MLILMKKQHLSFQGSGNAIMRSMSVKKQTVKIQIDNGVTDRGTQTRQQ